MKIFEVVGTDPNIDAANAARNLKLRYPQAKDQMTAILADIEKNERDGDRDISHNKEKIRDLESRLGKLEKNKTPDDLEEVAGPKDCWDGYKKVGTKPGTGKNKGKRVNDCEKA